MCLHHGPAEYSPLICCTGSILLFLIMEMTRLAGKLVLLVYLVELLTNVSVKILFPALVKPSGAARKMEL